MRGEKKSFTYTHGTMWYPTENERRIERPKLR